MGETSIEKRSSLWLSAVLRSIGDAVIACDVSGEVVFMNGVAEELTGWTQVEARGLALVNVFRIVNEATREPVENPVDKVKRLGTVVGLANHTLLLRRDGSEISIDDSGAPVYEPDAEGIAQLSGIVLIFRDITARRRAERNLELLSASGAALAASLDVPSTLQSIAHLCIQSFCDFCYFDLIGANGKLQRTTRRHRDAGKQVLLETASRAMPSLQDTNHPVIQAIREGKPTLVSHVDEEWRVRASLSEEHLEAMRALKFHSLLSIPLRSGSEELGVLSFCRATHPHPFDEDDLRVGAELGRRVAAAIMNGRLYRTLATREQSLQLALQAGRIGIWEYQPLTGRLAWSPRCSEIFGLAPDEELTLERNFELLHPEDRDQTLSIMNAALDPEGNGEYSVEFRAVRPTGEVRLVSAKGRAFFERNENPLDGGATTIATRFVGMVLDVTETRHAEAAIRTSEARFRGLIENGSVGILIASLDGSISYANPTLLQLLGYTLEDSLSGKLRWDLLTPPEYAERDARAVAQLRSTGTCEPYEKAYLHADGRQIPILLGATMIATEQASTPQAQDVAVFVTDLTGLRQTETALRESEKLAAVGRLAGSIAHEINNPLEAVTNLLYLLNSEVQTLPLQQIVATAQEELARVSHIVTHTLRFHRQATRPTLTRMSTVLESVLALYRGRLSNAEVSVSTRYREGRPLLCYEGELRQVLANLVGNALDATPKGGRLLLRARAATNWRSGSKGETVTVADTGSGMDPETLGNAFKAFFTTKGIGGTGLGLWISDEIIQKHAGRMRVRSRTLGGASWTVFCLWLPYDRN